MNLTRYDKVIWRINAAIIAMAGLTALTLMLVVGYKMFQEIFRDRNVIALVNTNAEAQREESLSLERFFPLQSASGTQRRWLVAALKVGQDYQQSYYSKTASSIRNYLFYDTQSRTRHWLLDNNSSLILGNYEIFEDPNVSAEKKSVNGLIYEVVKKDTNKDSRLSSEDKKSLVFYSLSGKTAVDLPEEIEELLGVEQISTKEALIFFREKKKSFVVTFDLLSKKLGEPEELFKQ